MCNQTYYINKRTRKSKSCPYAELYRNWENSMPKDLKLLRGIDLPHDEDGKCIFHSDQTAWKKEHHFGERFEDLISLVIQDKSLEEIDFRAFIFTGGNQKTRNLFRFNQLTFDRSVKFNDAQFRETIIFKNTNFKGGNSFEGAVFQGVARFDHCTINGGNFEKATFNAPTYFLNVNFNSYTTFINVKFLNGLKIIQTSFKHLVYFDNCLFEVKDPSGSKITFQESTFELTTIFDKSVFNCAVVFDRVNFNNKTDFIDTRFNLKQTIDAMESALAFRDFTVKDTGTLNFTSTDPLDKLFKGEVSFIYDEEALQGLIQFENANFHYLSEDSKKALQHSEKLGKVEIGKGCIKYRFQSDKKTIVISPDNQRFIIEITQVFANYFTNHHGLNLGIEIVERSAKSITYFFFSDENISDETFNDRMQESEYDLWELLFTDKDDFLETGQQLVHTKQLDQATFINTVDSIAAMVSILFRLKTRSDFGLWSEEDTAAFITSINQNQPVIFKIDKFHVNLIENLNQKTFFEYYASFAQKIKTQNQLIGKNSTYIKKKVDKRPPKE